VPVLFNRMQFWRIGTVPEYVGVRRGLAHLYRWRRNWAMVLWTAFDCKRLLRERWCEARGPCKFNRVVLAGAWAYRPRLLLAPAYHYQSLAVNAS